MKNTERTLQKDRRILAVLASGKYTVTRDGRVFNADRELKLHKDIAGYLRVNLQGISGARVSRVVALAHLDLPVEYREINHKNGIKADNRVDNLEWVTPKQNCQHARDTGLRAPPQGDIHGRATLTNAQAAEINALLIDGTIPLSDIAKRYGVKKSVVDNISMGQTWRHITMSTKPPGGKPSKRGEFNGNALLNEADVIKIRQRIKAGETIAQIARDYSVNRSTVSRIKSGQLWGNLK